MEHVHHLSRHCEPPSSNHGWLEPQSQCALLMLVPAVALLVRASSTAGCLADRLHRGDQRHLAD